MHITSGKYNQVVRGIDYGRDIPGFMAMFATYRRTAIKRFHVDGEEVARAYLLASLAPIYAAGHPQMVGNARVTEELFDKYVAMSNASAMEFDGRSAGTTVRLGTHTVGTRTPLLLSSPAGYVSRLVFWDRAPLESTTAEVIAVPYVHAMSEVLDDPVDGVELWHVRSGDQFFVSEAGAVAHDRDAERILDDYEDKTDGDS